MLSATLHDVILALFDAASRAKHEVLHQAELALSCLKVELIQQSIEDFSCTPPFFQTQTWLSKNLEHALSTSGLRFDEWHPNCVYFSVENHVSARVHFSSTEIMLNRIAHQECQLLIPLIQQALRVNLQLNQQKQDHLAIEHVLARHPLAKAFPTNTISLAHLAQEKEAANDPPQNLRLDKKSVMQFFQLTPSETELARLLFEGFCLEHIAQKRAVSKQTIRKQLQSILKKTDCDSQETLLLKLFDLSITSLKAAPSSHTSLRENS